MRLSAGIWAVTLAGARQCDAPICNRSFTTPFHAHVNPIGGCLGRLPGPRRNTTRPVGSHNCRSAKKLAQQGPSSDISAKKLAQHARKRQFWAIFRAQGELFRAHSHHQTEQGELFRAQDTATWQLRNRHQHCARKPHQKHPFLSRKGDGGFSPTQAPASKGDDGFRQPGYLACSTQTRRPWAAAGPGRASRRRAEPHVSTPGPTGVEGAGGPGCGARGRQRGLAGQRADAQSHTSAHQAPQVWRAPEGPGGTGESPDAGPGRGAGGRWQGQGGPRDRPLRAAGSRVAISRAGRRPPAHTAARTIKASHAAPGTPVGPQATSSAHKNAHPEPGGRI